MKPLCVTIEMKAIEQYCRVTLNCMHVYYVVHCTSDFRRFVTHEALG